MVVFVMKNNQIETTNGLTAAQQAQVSELRKNCPQIVAAIDEVQKFEHGLAMKYYGLCLAIRETRIEVAPGATRGLNRRETSLLLKSYSYSPSRVAEINRVVECPDELWQQYKEKTIGFRATLEKARLADAEGGEKVESEETEEEKDPLPKQEGAKPAVLLDAVFPPKVRESLGAALGGESAKLLTPLGGDRSYSEEFAVKLGKGKKARKFLVRIWAEDFTQA